MDAQSQTLDRENVDMLFKTTRENMIKNCIKNVGGTVEGQSGNLTFSCSGEKGVEDDIGFRVVEGNSFNNGENRVVNDNTGSLGTNVNDKCINVDKEGGICKGIGIEIGIGVDESFGLLGEGVLLQNGENGGVHDNTESLVFEGNYVCGDGNCIEADKRGALDKGIVVNAGMSVVENRVNSDNNGLLCTETVNGGNYSDDDRKCTSVDKEVTLDMVLEGKTEISVGQCFGHSNGKVLCENSFEKMDTNGISLVVELSNDNCVGECDVVESKIAENKDDQENVYLVGDFVWGKFNSHPWWPAQIYDPSDASDLAKKWRPKGKSFLVAFFGDGSFSWRSPDQLKPFSEEFNVLLKQTDSVIFLSAVKNALDEIGRVAELKLTCPCISEEQRVGLIKEEMVNAGIKEVTMTECDFNRVPVSGFEPLEILSKLRNIAVGDSGKSLLELVGMMSCISAFNRARYRRKVDCCYEGLVIEGMWDRNRRGFRDGLFMQRCDGLFEDNLTGTKKRKHVNVKANRKNKIKSNGKSVMAWRNEFLSVENGHEEGQVKGLDENIGGVIEENREVTLSRTRKKSRYLSYPFTDLSLKRDFAAELRKISKIACVGEKRTSDAAKLIQSSPIWKKKLSGKFENGVDNDQKKIIEPAKLEASPEEVVTKAQAAALDPQTFFSSDSREVVNDFIYAYRKVAIANGSNDKKTSKKRKSLSCNDQNETNDEMVRISEFMSEMQKKKRAKKNVDGVTNIEGLLFIKKKLEKMTEMVNNCDGDKFVEMKIELEIEMKGLLEKISTMVKTA